MNAGGHIKTRVQRVRSVKYPSHTVYNCFEVVYGIDKEFSDISFTPKDSISNAIGLSGGSFDMLISSCTQYDLLEKKMNEGYKPTVLFKKIKKPLPGENTEDFFRQCLTNPPLYKKLFADFAGKTLPSQEGLSNILDRLYDVKGNAAIIASKVFLKNANYCGLINGENILVSPDNGDSIVEIKEYSDNDAPNIQSENSVTAVTLLPQTTEKKENLATKEIPIFLKNKREAKVILPSDFTEDDLQKISNVISAYLL